MNRGVKSGWEEAVDGESVAYARGIRALSAGVVSDAVNTTAGFRLIAKCGVQRLSELHRKERNALRLDLCHLPTPREFRTQERIALRLKD